MVEAPLACELSPDFKIQDPYTLSLLKQFKVPVSKEIKLNSQKTAYKEINPFTIFHNALFHLEAHLSHCNHEVSDLHHHFYNLKLLLNQIALMPSKITFRSNDSQLQAPTEALNQYIKHLQGALSGAEHENYEIIINTQQTSAAKREGIYYDKSDVKKIFYNFFISDIDIHSLGFYQKFVYALVKIRTQIPMRFKRHIPFKSIQPLLMKIDFIRPQDIKNFSQKLIFIIFIPLLFTWLYRSYKSNLISRQN